MSFLTAILVPDEQYGDISRRYDKMGLNSAEQVMSQGKKDQAGKKGSDDVHLLKDLIKRSREGETQAIEALYERYKRPLFNLIYRHTYDYEAAEDLLQEVFLKIFTNLQDIQNEETFGGWAYRIALNTCYSYLRGKRSHRQKTTSLNEVEGTIKDEADEPHQRMIRRPLDIAIQTLPGKLKSIFLLHDVQGFKHQEIAQMLGCSVGTSKSQLFKARMRLREYLKNKQML